MPPQSNQQEISRLEQQLQDRETQLQQNPAGALGFGGREVVAAEVILGRRQVRGANISPKFVSRVRSAQESYERENERIRQRINQLQFEQQSPEQLEQQLETRRSAITQGRLSETLGFGGSFILRRKNTREVLRRQREFEAQTRRIAERLAELTGDPVMETPVFAELGALPEPTKRPRAPSRTQPQVFQARTDFRTGRFVTESPLTGVRTETTRTGVTKVIEPSGRTFQTRAGETVESARQRLALTSVERQVEMPLTTRGGIDRQLASNILRGTATERLLVQQQVRREGRVRDVLEGSRALTLTRASERRRAETISRALEGTRTGAALRGEKFRERTLTQRFDAFEKRIAKQTTQRVLPEIESPAAAARRIRGLVEPQTRAGREVPLAGRIETVTRAVRFGGLGLIGATPDREQREFLTGTLITSPLRKVRDEPLKLTAEIGLGAATGVGVSAGRLGVARFAPRALPAVTKAGIGAERVLLGAFAATKGAEFVAAPTAGARGEVLGGAAVELGAFGLGAGATLRPAARLEARAEIETALTRLPRETRPEARKILTETFSKVRQVGQPTRFSELKLQTLKPKEVKAVSRVLSEESTARVFGTTAQRVQLPKELRGKRLPEDIDIASANPEQTAQRLGAAIRRSGTKNVEVKGAKVVVRGQKAIEVKPLERLREFAFAERGVVTTPEGVRLVPLKEQAKRKAVGTITQAALGDVRRVKDIASTREILRASLVQSRRRAEQSIFFRESRIRAVETRSVQLEEAFRSIERLPRVQRATIAREQLTGEFGGRGVSVRLQRTVPERQVNDFLTGKRGQFRLTRQEVDVGAVPRLGDITAPRARARPTRTVVERQISPRPRRRILEESSLPSRRTFESSLPRGFRRTFESSLPLSRPSRLPKGTTPSLLKPSKLPPRSTTPSILRPPRTTTPSILRPPRRTTPSLLKPPRRTTPSLLKPPRTTTPSLLTPPRTPPSVPPLFPPTRITTPDLIPPSISRTTKQPKFEFKFDFADEAKKPQVLKQRPFRFTPTLDAALRGDVGRTKGIIVRTQRRGKKRRNRLEIFTGLETRLVRPRRGRNLI